MLHGNAVQSTKSFCLTRDLVDGEVFVAGAAIAMQVFGIMWWLYKFSLLCAGNGNRFKYTTFGVEPNQYSSPGVEPIDKTGKQRITIAFRERER